MMLNVHQLRKSLSTTNPQTFACAAASNEESECLKFKLNLNRDRSYKRNTIKPNCLSPQRSLKSFVFLCCHRVKRKVIATSWVACARLADAMFITRYVVMRDDEMCQCHVILTPRQARIVRGIVRVSRFVIQYSSQTYNGVRLTNSFTEVLQAKAIVR
jgi:hypothetical protein